MSGLSHSNTATRAELLAELRERVATAGGPSAFANETGVSPQLVSMTLNGRREVGAPIANALGFMQPGYFIRREKV